MNWIHGHDCIHNLIISKRYLNEYGDRDISDYSRLITSGLPLTWAVHSFSVDESNSYDLVCKDLGYALPQLLHPWGLLNTRELFSVLCSFGWREHVESMNIGDIQNPDYIYTRWYNNVFAGHISSAQYWNTILGPKTLPLDTVI